MSSEQFEDFVDFKCPYCDAMNSFPGSAAGTVRECVNCVRAFIVPAPGEEHASKLPYPIETPKLRLRPFEPGDWQYWKELELQSEEQAIQWIQQQASNRLASAQETYLAIEDKEAQKIAGWITLRFMDFAFNQIEISVFANASAKAQGLDVEAMTAALELCFSDFHVHRVCAQCYADEEELCRLFPAVGMKKEAEFRKNESFGDTWRSTCWFAMLNEEYSQS